MKVYNIDLKNENETKPARTLCAILGEILKLRNCSLF